MASQRIGARGGRYGRANGPLVAIVSHQHHDYGYGMTIYCRDRLSCGHVLVGRCSGVRHVASRRCHVCMQAEHCRTREAE